MSSGRFSRWFRSTVVVLLVVTSSSQAAVQTARLVSPNGEITATVMVADQLRWNVARKGRTVLASSRLGLAFAGAPKFGTMRIRAQSERTCDETWENRRYKKRFVRDHFRELTLELEEVDAPRRRLDLVFRAYDTGVAFRYGIPEQPAITTFTIRGEQTEFRFQGDPLGWFTLYPSEHDGQEQPFLHRSIRSIPLKTPFDASTRAPEMTRIGLPAIVELDGQVAAIAEAELSDWAGLFLEPVKRWGQRPDQSTLAACLAARPDGRGCVVSSAPRQSPWRVIALADDATGLVALTDLIQNLNPPPAGDFSWVKTGPSGWDWWAESAYVVSQKKNRREDKIAQIDFAAEMGWPFYTIDVYWCTTGVRKPDGTTGSAGIGGFSDLTVDASGFDLPGVIAHAREKGVGVFLWTHWRNLESNGVERVFAQFEKWGVAGVKVDFMERQDQEMVNWYEKVVRCAARHRLLVNFHGAFHPTGMDRTWPNQITREGICANENHRYDWILTPELMAGLPLTRYLIGPGDYYPGGFTNVRPQDFTPPNVLPPLKRGYTPEVGTRAHALALCVAYDSPLLTLADVPENYRGQPGVEALRNLPSVWEETRVLGGEINAWYLAARKSYGGKWYLAAITAAARRRDCPLDFLGDGTWSMTLYADDPAANAKDMKALRIATRTVTRGDVLSLDLAAIGGCVAIFERK